MSKNKQARVAVAQVNALKPDEMLRDTEIQGFGARRRDSAPSYFLQTRVKGRLRWFTVGKHGSPWTQTTARDAAIRLIDSMRPPLTPSLVKPPSSGRVHPIAYCLPPGTEEILNIAGRQRKPKIAERIGGHIRTLRSCSQVLRHPFL